MFARPAFSILPGKIGHATLQKYLLGPQLKIGGLQGSDSSFRCLELLSQIARWGPTRGERASISQLLFESIILSLQVHGEFGLLGQLLFHFREDLLLLLQDGRNRWLSHLEFFLFQAD